MRLKEPEKHCIFDICHLEVGDVLLMKLSGYAGCSEISENIPRRMAVYIGDGYMIEDVGDGLRVRCVLACGFKSENDVCVLRLKGQGYRVKAEAMAWAQDRTGCRISADCKKAGVGMILDFGLHLDEDTLSLRGFELVKGCLREYGSDVADIVDAVGHSDVVWGVRHADNQFVDSLVGALNKPEKADELLESLQNFNWMDFDGNLSGAWFWDDKDFFAHFKSTEKVLDFIYGRFMFYDNVWLPVIRENVGVLEILTKEYGGCKTIVYICERFRNVLDEAVRARRRLQYLYKLSQERDWDGFFRFVKLCGMYVRWEYKEEVVNLRGVLWSLREK